MVFLQNAAGHWGSFRFCSSPTANEKLEVLPIKLKGVVWGSWPKPIEAPQRLPKKLSQKASTRKGIKVQRFKRRFHTKRFPHQGSKVPNKGAALRFKGPSWRQVGDKWRHADQSTHSIQNVLGEKWETTGDKLETKNPGDTYKTSERPEFSEHPECSRRQLGNEWRQVGDKPEITRSENRVQRETNRETSAKSCGQRIQCSGENWESRGRQMETSRRQVWNHAGRESRMYWETSGRQVGDK